MFVITKEEVDHKVNSVLFLFLGCPHSYISMYLSDRQEALQLLFVTCEQVKTREDLFEIIILRQNIDIPVIRELLF